VRSSTSASTAICEEKINTLFDMLDVKNFAVPFILKLLSLPTLFIKLISILRFDSHVRQV
jgi:hypothetical protein